MVDKNINITPKEYKKVTEELYKQNLELARLYKQLDVMNHELQVANEGQANLIHIMNHQIKGYLAKARNIFSELIETPEYNPPEVAKPLIEEGFGSLTEGVEFVQGILSVANIEKGTLKFVFEEIDMKSLVIEIAEKEKHAAIEKGLSYKVNIVEGDYRMKGDKVQLTQALRNVIDNSIKYTPEGGLEISLSYIDKKILLSVKDTGVGISDELKSRLFTKGGVDDDSRKIKVYFIGFGLVFVKGVVEAHKGRVWVESEGKGRGSTFFVELPART